jgi:hypothetical protein
MPFDLIEIILQFQIAGNLINIARMIYRPNLSSGPYKQSGRTG